MIGIDPGAANTGFGVVQHDREPHGRPRRGAIETAPDIAASERLARIHDSLGQLISWHEPTAMALEDLLRPQRLLGALRRPGERGGDARRRAAGRALLRLRAGREEGRHPAPPARRSRCSRWSPPCSACLSLLARPRRRRLRRRDLPRGRGGDAAVAPTGAPAAPAPGPVPGRLAEVTAENRVAAGPPSGRKASGHRRIQDDDRLRRRRGAGAPRRPSS